MGHETTILSKKVVKESCGLQYLILVDGQNTF